MSDAAPPGRSDGRAPTPGRAQRLLEAERLLTVGLTDRAEAIYRDLLVADARDSHALVGLARVALQRGDDRTAHELAAEARAADPSNEAAIRMEARMAEVLAYRGEPAAPPPRPGTPSRGARDRRALIGRILRRR